MSFIEAGSELPTICIPATQSPVEEFAVNELQTYLKRITGQSLKIEKTDDHSEPSIFVGTHDAYISIHGKDSLKNFEAIQHPDGFLMQLDENHLKLVGRGPTGVLAAVYQILEFLGVRWFEPGPEGEELTHLQKVDLGKAERHLEPLVGQRGLFNVTDPDAIDWMGKNRLNHLIVEYQKFKSASSSILDETSKRGISLEIISSSLSDWLNSQDGILEEPEVCALVDGKRIEQNGEEPPSICPTHSLVQKAVVKGIADFLNEYSEVKTITLDLTKDITICECDRCKKLRGQERRQVPRVDRTTGRLQSKAPLLSESIWSLFHEIKTKVNKAHPECLFRALVQEDTFYPPLNGKFLKEAGGLLRINGRCYRHVLNSAECVPNHCLWQPLETWAKRSETEILLQDSIQGPDEFLGLLFPSVRLSGTEVLILYDLGINGLTTDAFWDGSTFNALTLWTFARQVWSGEGSIDPIIEDFYNRYYGPASDEMRAYFRVWYFRWLDLRGCFLGRGMDLLRLMGFEQFIEAQKYLEAALKLTSLAGHQKKRVKREMANFNLAGHAWNFMHSVLQANHFRQNDMEEAAQKQEDLIAERREILINFVKNQKTHYSDRIDEVAEGWAKRISLALTK